VERRGDPKELAVERRGNPKDLAVERRGNPEDLAALISEHYKGFNRGKVPNQVMDKIGYEDCDYISFESSWNYWGKFKELSSLELHVPCREPLSPLMSQCNCIGTRFNCSSDDLPNKIKKCLLFLGRFSRALGEQNNTNLNCFNPIPIEPCLEFMSKRLQCKRIDDSTYVHCATNKPRNKDLECIWNEPDVATQVRDTMLQKCEYCGFCEECMGSKDDLLADGQ
jgi:hypothetical protein